MRDRNTERSPAAVVAVSFRLRFGVKESHPGGALDRYSLLHKTEEELARGSQAPAKRARLAGWCKSNSGVRGINISPFHKKNTPKARIIKRSRLPLRGRKRSSADWGTAKLRGTAALLLRAVFSFPVDYLREIC